MSRAFVQYNDDATNLWDVEPGHARVSMVNLIDRVIDAIPIDIYSVQCASPDITEFELSAGEALGNRIKYQPEKVINNLSIQRRIRGIKALRDEGTDHLAVYADRLHQRGIKCVAEMRMSDTHHTQLTPDDPWCAMFAIEHPEWVIRRNDGVNEVALDYSYPEVRAHRLAILTELAKRRDVDGLELNFNRWAKHFSRHEARSKAPIMTDFIAEIHAMMNRPEVRLGRDKLLLGARVLSTMEECLDAGCNPRAWVENGWLDYLIVSEYNCTWPATPVDEFAGFCRGRCKLLAQMGDGIGGIWNGPPKITNPDIPIHAGHGNCYAGMLLSPATARGAAHNYYTWGADGISFWNICCSIGTRGKNTGSAHRQRMFNWMNEVIDPQKVKSGSRCYHYLPLYKGIEAKPRNYAVRRTLCSPNGAFKGTVLLFDQNMRRIFPFRMADGRYGEKLHGEMRWRALNCPGYNPFIVDVNGTTIPTAYIKMESDAANRNISSQWVILDLENCPPLKGDNELGLKLTGTPLNPATYVEELQITVY